MQVLCGDLRPHIITNVGLQDGQRAGMLMRDSLLDSAPARDRPFLRCARVVGVHAWVVGGGAISKAAMQGAGGERGEGREPVPGLMCQGPGMLMRDSLLESAPAKDRRSCGACALWGCVRV